MKLLIILMLAVGCGTDSSKDSTTPASIQGEWKSECIQASEGLYVELYMNNDAETSTYEMDRYYNDPNCLKLRVKDQIVRSYTLGEGNNIDFVVQSVTRTIYYQDDVVTANAEENYGFDDWQVGVAKDTSGMNEQGVSTGENLYYIFKIEDGKFYGADLNSGDGKTEATRPNEFYTKIPLEKQ